MGKTRNSLCHARIGAGLTIDDVALRVRVLPARVERWEAGAEIPETDTLYALAALYETPPHKLLLNRANFSDQPSESNGNFEEFNPALDAFRRELTAMRAADLLPLDDETIDYCVGKMRDRLTSGKQQN